MFNGTSVRASVLATLAFYWWSAFTPFPREMFCGLALRNGSCVVVPYIIQRNMLVKHQNTIPHSNCESFLMMTPDWTVLICRLAS